MKSSLRFGRVMGLLFLLPISTTLTAQNTSTKVEEARKTVLSDPKVASVAISPERETPATIVLKKGQAYGKDQTGMALGNYLSLRSGVDELRPAKVSKVTSTIEVLEYQQYYKGIKVDRAGYKALVKDGKVQFFNGAWYNVPTALATTPALVEMQALGKAKSKIGARKYAWEAVQEKMDKTSDVRIKGALQKELDEYQPKGELVIINDFNKKGVASPRLAYKFNIYAAEPLSRAWVYIDAQDGRTLLVDKIIKHVDNPGQNPAPTSVSATVQTRYAGTQVIKTKRISGNDPVSGLPITSSHPTSELLYIPGAATYVLIDDTRGNGIETYDMNGVGGLPLSVPSLYLQGKSFTDMDNNWTLAEHHRSPANEGPFELENDDIAWDAHWGAEEVYDYWLAKHDRLSYDGNNSPIKSFIHYGPAYDNAFWNGSVMTYGDGSGTAANGFKALTSLDVCGHEIGHGVCSSTSDLVYQGESGAMNEALSDIWASCIEHFAMTRSGSTVPSSAYRPFYIGEQIGADADHPLRRMDNPQAVSNPDTYGGTNWSNPDCAPNLANDQCGVHNNSGLLNKWFFLITAGSKSGIRPAGITANQYYFADSDDEENDLGNSYVVNGIGFDQAEDITFLMETMLTSTATYAEAREVSVQVANALSGDPCSSVVETITNAWYAIGVGDKFVKPCTVTYGFIYKPGAATSEAGTTSGCTSEKTMEVPVLLPAGSTATLTLAGTAIQGQDYTVSATSLNNAGTTIAKRSFIVTIKNDGIVEGDETIALKITLTNAGANPVNSTYTITLLDDDVVPVIGNTEKVLVNESFDRADGFADPTGWTETLEIPEGSGDPQTTGKNQWGIFDNALAITGKEGLTDTQFPNGMYNSNSQSQTLIKSPLIDARGLSVLNIKFDYKVQGEADAQSIDPANPDIERLPVFDYMAVAYSLDGINFTELNTGDFKQFASILPANGAFSGILPASLTNKQFYLAFRWVNDGNAGGPVSVSIDNLLVKGAPRKIENDLNNNGRENLNAGQEVYFYSVQDGEVLGKVKNNSTKSFGCTNVYVEKAGTGSFNLYQGNGGLHKVADKVIRIEASTASKVSNTVSLYFTDEQLKNLELATGRNRTEFSVYQVGAASYAQAASNNTKKYTPVYTPIDGVGGYYTITFSDYVNGSYALGYQVTLFLTNSAVTSTETQLQVDRWKFAAIYPNPGSSNAYLQVAAPQKTAVKLEVVNTLGQLVYTQAEQLPQGVSRISLRMNKLTSGSYMIRTKAEDGTMLDTQTFVKQ
ncbi:MAG: peptidase [Flaviaesturariibacter sp.]|nr:peptidase [Flaviaesturariibacter sp.]